MHLHKKKNKYHAKKKVVGGIKFDSKKEARRYVVLKILEKEGTISNLKLQPEFVLQDAFHHDGKKIRAIKYRADFSYSRGGLDIVEDTKGYKTQVYNIKKKMLLKKYPDIRFIET